MVVDYIFYVRGARNKDYNRWFVDTVRKVVGNGDETLFWEDLWVEGGILHDIFRRLYHLTSVKNIMVANMCDEDDGVVQGIV